MLRVGLTGGLASGKSTVAGVFRDLGAAVFDADAIVRDLYRPGGEAAGAARELLGERVLDAKGGVDRGRVALAIFQDPSKRQALETRLHPLVKNELERRFEMAEKRGAVVGVAEASQLLESSTEDSYDKVLLVVAPEAERIRRWVAKGNLAADAKRRIAAQISPEKARERVSEVLVNDGSFEELRRKVQA
ncbi:MAG: dephospho-CoA kinase, partial [Thermoanaerobaculia bacterium]